nr:alpha/beta hydrolase [Rhodococcus sp. (in: high G+C Gram-positive bacteria)]
MTSVGSTTVVGTSRGPVEYQVRGRGRPVLVLHGSPGGIDAAEAMSRFLPEDRFVSVLLSRPGYLGTELGDRCTPDDQADLYAALLDELGIEKVGVLAWSGGGPSAFRFAAKYPDRVTSLVALACLSGPWVDPASDLSTRLFQSTRVGDWLMRKLVARQPLQVIRGAVASESSLTGEDLEAEIQQIASDESKKQFVLDLALTASRVGRRRDGWRNDCLQFAKSHTLGLDVIAAPTLLVQGSADSDVVPANSDRAHQDIVDSELLTLDLGTHFAFYTHPSLQLAQAKAIEYLLRS